MKKVLSSLLATSLVLTAVTNVSAKTFTSPSEGYFELAEGIKGKFICQYSGDEDRGIIAIGEDINCQEATDTSILFDGNTNSELILRDGSGVWGGRNQKGDYVGVEFENPITFKGATFHTHSNDTYQDAKMEVLVGDTWNVVKEFGVSKVAVMAYSGEAIKNVKAVRIVNGIYEEQKWLRISEIEVEADAAADYAALDAAIEQAEALNKDKYVDFTDVEAKLTEAKAVARDLTTADQSLIDNAVKALKDAINALEKLRLTIEIPVEEMTATTGNAQELSGSNTTEGPARFAIDGNPNTFWHTDWFPQSGAGRDDHWLQITFDELKEIKGMKIQQRGGDWPNGQITKYDLYGRISEDAEWELIVDDGTLETITAMQEVSFDLTEVKEVKLVALEGTSDKPGQEFSAVAEIRFIETGVDVEAVADYTAVNEAIEEANALNKEIYANFDAVEEAIEAVVRGLRVSAQDEVDAYAAAINAAVAALQLKGADYSAVDAAIEAANGLDKTLYTNFSAVTAAINAVNRNYKADKQAEVDAMAKAINDAINALTLKTADYSALAEVLATLPESLENYTDETVEALEAVISTIEYDLDITKQAEVDALVEAVEAAIDALALKAADYSEVEAAIEAANRLNKADYKDFSKVEMAIAAVVEGLDITRQDEVDAFVQAILNAILGLEPTETPAPTPTPDPEEPEVPAEPEEDEEDEEVVTPEDDEEEVETPEVEDENVNTSDNTSVFGFAAMMVTALFAIFTARKRKED